MMSSAFKSARCLGVSRSSIRSNIGSLQQQRRARSSRMASFSDYMLGTPEVDPNAKAATAPAINSTVLPNGFTIITQDVPYSPVSYVGFFVNAGSRVETSREVGASHLIQSMAFKSTVSSSELILTRELEKTGATINSQTSREAVIYDARCLREAVPRIVELFSETVMFPRLGGIDIEQHVNTIKNEILDYTGNPQFMVNENLHAQAFHNSTLASPLLCPPHNLVRFSPAQLGNFHAKWYTPKNITISATNFEHDKLVTLAQQLLGELRPIESAKATLPNAPKYVGGEIVAYDEHAPLPDDPSRAYIALGYEAVGARHTDAYATSVLQAVLGRGNNTGFNDSVFAQSRINQNVLKKASFIQNANTFNLAYSDIGLVGIYVEADSKNATEALQMVSAEVKKTADSLTNEEVERAKKAVVVNYLTNMGGIATAANSNYADMKLTGKIASQADVVAKIQAVTLADVKRVLERALSSKPTVSAYGELFDLKL